MFIDFLQSRSEPLRIQLWRSSPQSFPHSGREADIAKSLSFVFSCTSRRAPLSVTMIKTSRSAGVIPQYRDFSCIRRRDPSYRGEKSFSCRAGVTLMKLFFDITFTFSRKAGVSSFKQEQPTFAFLLAQKQKKQKIIH